MVLDSSIIMLNENSKIVMVDVFAEKTKQSQREIIGCCRNHMKLTSNIFRSHFLE
jgi:hypothetical protein